MARFVFRLPVDNRFDGIDFGFVTGEEVVSNSSTKIVGRFDSTLLGEVTLTVNGSGLRLGDNASDFLSGGVLNGASLSADGRVFFSASGIDLPVQLVDDIITSPRIYRGDDIIIGSSESDELSGFGGADRIKGGGGFDLLFGGGGADRLVGGAGGDSILGGGGADSLFGGGGNDDRLLGAGGQDFIKGGGGADGLFGGGGADNLDGGGGADTLDGGRGRDVMKGGAGNDTFVFSQGRDRITDFSSGDQIDLSNVFFAGSFEDILEEGLVDETDGAVITISGAKLVLEGVTISDLGESDFLFF